MARERSEIQIYCHFNGKCRVDIGCRISSEPTYSFKDLGGLLITVYVWTKDQSATSPNGHAAIEIGVGHKLKSTYVSFYPSSKDRTDIAMDGVAAQLGYKMPDKCYSSFYYKSLAEDVAKEWGGQFPKLKVSIDGLNEQSMIQKWEESKAGRWCLVSNNCSSMVATLLHAGSGVSGEDISAYLHRYSKENKQKFFTSKPNDSFLNKIDNFIGTDIIPDSKLIRNPKVPWIKSHEQVRKEDTWSVRTVTDSAYLRMLTPLKVYNYAIGLHYYFATTRRASKAK